MLVWMIGKTFTTPDDFLREATRLPLLDAAYFLWTRKSGFDQCEGIATPVLQGLSSPPTDAEWQRLARAVMGNLDAERAAADSGPTLRRLMAAHPQASEGEAKSAIRAAVKFEGDCRRAYTHDAKAAVEKAKRENPGFGEETFESALFALMSSMR